MLSIIYRHSAGKIVEGIAERMREKPELCPVRHRQYYMPNDTDALIRWGTTIRCPDINTYNPAEAIATASDKARCREILFDAGIPVPTPTEEPPCIGRTRKHKGGKGFWFCRTDRGVRRAKRKGAVYFSEFYPKTIEYRIHVANEKILLVSEKIGDPEKIIWNKRNGFTFKVLRRSRWPREAVRIALRAIETVGLDFGAVDMMAEPEDDSLEPIVVCEINTSPRLEDYASSRYAEYFNWLSEGFYHRGKPDRKGKAFKEGR